MAETGLEGAPEGFVKWFFIGVLGLVIGLSGPVAMMVAVFARQKRAVENGNQALKVSLAEEFATRREFDQFRATVNGDVKEIKGMFRLTMDKMDERDRRLSESIDRVAKVAYEGRKDLHKKATEHEAHIKSMEDRMKACGGKCSI